MKKHSKINFKSEYSNFFFNNDFIYTTDGNIFGQILDERLNEIKEFSELLRTLNLQNKYIYFENYSDNNREGNLFCTLTNKFTEFLYLEDYKITFGIDTYFLLTNRKFPETLLFDIEKKQILWKQDKYFSFQILENELLIDTEKKKLIRYDFHTGYFAWQYDLGERYDYYARNEQYLESPTEFHQAEIRKIIGVYQEILWISLNTGRLIGLSVHDGAVVYDIAVPNDYPHRFFAVASNSHLVAEQGKIIGLHAHWYWELDLKNPIESYKLYILDDECTKHSLDVDHLRFHCLVGNELFFAQEEWAQEPSYVGIFDIQTKKITWTSHELGEDNVFQGIKKVEYQSNRLYVLDKASCLHIFEREANS